MSACALTPGYPLPVRIAKVRNVPPLFICQPTAQTFPVPVEEAPTRASDNPGDGVVSRVQLLPFHLVTRPPVPTAYTLVGDSAVTLWNAPAGGFGIVECCQSWPSQRSMYGTS